MESAESFNYQLNGTKNSSRHANFKLNRNYQVFVSFVHS